MAKSFLVDLLLNNTLISAVRAVLFNAEYDNGNSGTSKTINFANGQKQKVMLTANAVLTIATPPGVGSFQLRLIQDGTGSRTVTWSGLNAARWIGAIAAPAINSAANGETLLTVFYDGTNAVQSLAKIGVNYTPGDAAPSGAQYLTLATDATLSAERVLTAGRNLTITDAGAGGAATITPTFSPGRATARAAGYANP